MLPRMTAQILGIGLATPPHTMSQDEAASLAREVICRGPLQERVLTALYRKAGVSQRHTALPHRIALDWLPEVDETGQRQTTLGPTTAERMKYFAEHAPSLAMSAAGHALDVAHAAAGEITHLITVTCTGFDAPGLDVAVIRGLALRPTTQRLQVGFMGCHGAINGLRAGLAIVSADQQARVLLVATELCSLHYRFQWDPERLVANALFADGAAAVVLGAHRQSTGDTSVPPSGASKWRLKATGSCLIPDSREAMSWRIGDHGFEMTLDAAVPELIQKNLKPWLVSWLAEHGLSMADVSSWAIHPGGPRILASIEESLGLARDATAVSREVLSQFGNMSSPTVLFILERLRAASSRLPCVAIGFGPGMFAEAALFA
jgi:predicted naringenin-chalcone synthase